MERFGFILFLFRFCILKTLNWCKYRDPESTALKLVLGRKLGSAMAEVEITASYWVVREGITEKTKFQQRPRGRRGACQGNIWEEYTRKKRESIKPLQGEHACDEWKGSWWGRNGWSLGKVLEDESQQ